MSSRGPRLIIPSGLLIVVAAMLVPLTANANRSSATARLVLVAIAAAVLADGALAHRALRRVTATVATPALATCGTRFPARVCIDGVGRPATVDPLFVGQPAQPFLSGEPFTLACLPSHRGMFNHLLMEVRCRGPLGLWVGARRIAVHLEQPLSVAPAPTAVPPIDPPAADAAADALAGTTRSGDELVRTVRAYEPGDSIRRVHWPATAHRGVLMVRETEDDAGPVPTLLVDLAEPGLAAERAMSRAMSRAGEAVTNAGRVRLVTTEPSAEDHVVPIPRSVLVPGAPLRVRPVPSIEHEVVDRVERDIDGVRLRLARASAAPLPARSALQPLPPGIRVTNGGDDRFPSAVP